MIQRVQRFNDRNLLLLATALGFAAIIALPLTVTASPRFAAPLVFATPLLMVLLGVFSDLRWLRNLGVAVTVLLIGVIGAAMSGFTLPGGPFFAVAVLFVGPAVAAVGVGVPLRERDVVAAAAFLMSATIAVIAGFTGANAPGAPFMVIGIAVVGFIIVVRRLAD